MWAYLAIIVVFGGLLLFSQRNRKRRAAQEMQRVSSIEVGSEVMTTSGLYGTVVARHDDGTVLLSIAPGVEVKWASAALRTADALSATYRQGLTGGRSGELPTDTVDLRKASGIISPDESDPRGPGAAG